MLVEPWGTISKKGGDAYESIRIDLNGLSIGYSARNANQ
jgi:hypothetical protein